MIANIQELTCIVQEDCTIVGTSVSLYDTLRNLYEINNNYKECFKSMHQKLKPYRGDLNRHISYINVSAWMQISDNKGNS